VLAAASKERARRHRAPPTPRRTGQDRRKYPRASALAKQIEQCARLDVFGVLPTPTDGLRYVQKNITAARGRNLLGNTIVLIAPKDSRIDNVSSYKFLISQTCRRRARSRPRC